MKNKKKKKKVWLGVLVAALVVAGIGAGMKIYADTQKFDSGTTINGIDVSGFTVSQAKQVLLDRASAYKADLYAGGKDFSVTGDDLGLSLNPDADIESLLKQQQKDSSQTTFTVDDLFQIQDGATSKIVAKGLPVASQAQLAAIESADAVETSAISGDASGDAGSGDAIPAAVKEEPADGGTASGSATSTSTRQKLQKALEDNGIDSSDALYKALMESGDASGNAVLPKNAYTVYSKEKHSFVIMPDKEGTCLDSSLVDQEVYSEVQSLPDGISLDAGQLRLAARVQAENGDLVSAVNDLNSYLKINLTYTFTPKNGDSTQETLDADTIGSFLELDSGLKVRVNEEALGVYAEKLAQEHSTSDSTMNFKTSGGDTIQINAAGAGESVDANALYKDLLECIKDKKSGTREAPYTEADESSAAGLWGGNYVEIDLTSQHVWCYKDGELVVSAPMVSGNVSHGHATPTGVFTIFAKDTDRYLRGTNDDGTKYESYVHYFIPFCGGVGMHDASWRSSFGGDIYLYNGSHGCINMRYDDVKKIFDNVSIGTHVIVYGGKYVPIVKVEKKTAEETDTSEESTDSSSQSTSSESSSSQGSSSSEGSSGSSGQESSGQSSQDTSDSGQSGQDSSQGSQTDTSQEQGGQTEPSQEQQPQQ